MTEPTTIPRATVAVNTPRISLDPLLIGTVAMVVFLVLTLRANRKIHEREIASYRQSNERLMRIVGSYERVDTEKKRPEYSAKECAPECAEGHTYTIGCVHNVESPNAEAL